MLEVRSCSGLVLTGNTALDATVSTARAGQIAGHVPSLGRSAADVTDEALEIASFARTQRITFVILCQFRYGMEVGARCGVPQGSQRRLHVEYYTDLRSRRQISPQTPLTVMQAPIPDWEPYFVHRQGCRTAA